MKIKYLYSFIYISVCITQKGNLKFKSTVLKLWKNLIFFLTCTSLLQKQKPKTQSICLQTKHMPAFNTAESTLIDNSFYKRTFS